MFTRKTFFAAAMVGAVGAGMTAAACAQPGPGAGPGGWHHGGALLDGVTLTSDQKTKLETLMQAEHQSSSSLREQLHAIHEKIDTTLLSSGDVTEATLAPLVQQQESLMQQMDAQRITNEIAVRNLLTADQLATASSVHAQMVSLHEQEHALHSAGGEAPDQPE